MRWQWGSGSDHCTFVGGGCVVVDEDGQRRPRADGLAAPFVLFARGRGRAARHLGRHGDAGHREHRLRGARRVRARGPLGRAAAGPAGGRRAALPVPVPGRPGARGERGVGRAWRRRACDELVDLAGAKRPAQSSRTLAERSAVQADVARAETAHRSARAFVREQVAEAWEVARAGPLDELARRNLRLAATNATLSCTRAVDLMYEAAGGTAVYRTSPLERVFRDAHVATQHAMVAPRTLEVLGRVALGLPTDPGTF